MGRRPSRQRRPKREEVRRRLLEAATRVFARRGYAEATLEEVAAEAGFSKGAVYSNFASKEEVFYALLRERVAERVEKVHHAIESASTLQEMGAAAGRAGGEAVDEEADWHLLFLEFVTRAARQPALREELGQSIPPCRPSSSPTSCSPFPMAWRSSSSSSRRASTPTSSSKRSS